MVGHKLVQALLARNAGWEIVIFGDEPRPAYDRVHLSALFDGATADDLSLVGAEMDDPAVEACGHDPVVAIDRSAQTVTTQRGQVQGYDVAVLATGSLPFVPPVPGRDLPGCFVYRTIEDVEAIRAFATSGARRTMRGVVVGGGLLGLEAARALRGCNVNIELVEIAPRLMPAQVDDIGGRVLRDHIEAFGVSVRVATTIAGIEAGPDGAVAAVTVQAAGEDQTAQRLATDMVVFSAGIRPGTNWPASAAWRSASWAG
jgi:nitrite reductase (NADH) large subunit